MRMNEIIVIGRQAKAIGRHCVYRKISQTSADSSSPHRIICFSLPYLNLSTFSQSLKANNSQQHTLADTREAAKILCSHDSDSISSIDPRKISYLNENRFGKSKKFIYEYSDDKFSFRHSDPS